MLNRLGIFSNAGPWSSACELGHLTWHLFPSQNTWKKNKTGKFQEARMQRVVPGWQRSVLADHEGGSPVSGWEVGEEGGGG